MDLETPKTDTQHDDQAIALAHSAKEHHSEDVGGEDATILEFPTRSTTTPPQAGDTLIEGYSLAVADKRLTKKPETRLTLRGKAVLALGGLAAVVGLGAGLQEALDTDFHGEKTVTINKGDTVSDIAKNDVDGGASHTADTVNKIVAMNPDVFQDGKANLGSEDLGKDITVPESID